ncbi:MAG: hypothetical protein QOJ85_3135, partial [Solirubrobacteraceae bacterium]|nr:hypothetical protein [Solirubrobacteraceae bacterium]
CARRILGPEHPETLRVGAILAGSY